MPPFARSQLQSLGNMPGLGQRRQRLQGVRQRQGGLSGDGTLGDDVRRPNVPKAPGRGPGAVPGAGPADGFTFGRGLTRNLQTLGRYTRRKSAADFLQELLEINSVDPGFQRAFGNQTEFGMGDINTLLNTSGLVTNRLRLQFLNTLAGLQNRDKFRPGVGVTPFAQRSLDPNILARITGIPAPVPVPSPASDPEPAPTNNNPPPPAPDVEPEPDVLALLNQFSGPITEVGARATKKREQRQEALRQLIGLNDPRILALLGV